MNIIVCDDNPADRAVVTGLLRDYEKEKGLVFNIVEYNSGETLCLDEAALKQSQLVFLDINMAEMDGLKTAMKLKELYPDIYIVLVTAYMSYSLEGYKVKASWFLWKEDLSILSR